MSSASKKRLDGSWVVNGAEEADGNISWAEDSEPSDHDDRVHVNPQTPPRLRRALPKRTPGSGGTSSGPSFVMPSTGDYAHYQRSSVPTRQPAQTNTPSRNVRHVSRTISPAPRSTHRRSTQPASDKVVNMALGTGEYFLDIVVGTLKTLKKPISWVLAAYLFAGGLVFLQNLARSTIASALSPLCRIPGVSLLHVPICNSPYASSERPVVSESPSNPEFDALMTTQGKFENILQDSTAAISLPLQMKMSESSIRDLRQVVRFSSIPSKNELLHEFDGFIETARIASYDLQKFNSHVGRAVDSVLSIARWSERVLDDIALKSSQSSGVIGDFINNKLLAPFQPLQFTESRLLDHYLTHTRLIADEIERLIIEAQTLLHVLHNLDERLDVIHGISLRDNLLTESSRDEILSQLWTYIGGNRAKLGKVDNQLRLLARVGEYRQMAYAHVLGTILKLQAMGAELEELKTRVGAVDVAEDRGIQSLPLHVHIDNIRLGVERLEGQRKTAREVEDRHIRGVLDKANGDDQMILVEG